MVETVRAHHFRAWSLGGTLGGWADHVIVLPHDTCGSNSGNPSMNVRVSKPKLPKPGARKTSASKSKAVRPKASRPTAQFLDDENRMTFDREQQFQRKLDVILKTATASLNELGYSGTSLRKLAASLSITDSALYHYVKSKDELAYLCYMRSMDYSEAALAKAQNEGRTGLEKLEIYIRSQMHATCGPDGATATMSDLPSLRIPHRMRVLKKIDRCRDLVLSFFEEGFEDGTIQPCSAKDASLVIWGAMTFLAKWNDRHGKVDVDELADTYVHVLTHGVSAR
jgi:TetR/AcrR family transcriptional regulator